MNMFGLGFCTDIPGDPGGSVRVAGCVEMATQRHLSMSEPTGPTDA